MSKLKKQALLEIQKNNKIVYDAIISISANIQSIRHSISSLDDIPEKIAKSLKEKTDKYFEKIISIGNLNEKPYNDKITDAYYEIEKWVEALLEEEIEEEEEDGCQ